MNSKKILYKIKVLEKDYDKLKKELENHKILKSNKNRYLKEDKESFKLIWIKYIDLFFRLKKLIKYSKYRSYFFFIDYDKIVLRKYILIFYFNVIVDLEKICGKHMIFLRLFLEENFGKDYRYFVNYIYRPDFINLINTPNIFIQAFRTKIKKEIYPLLAYTHFNTDYSFRINVDYKNLFFYIKYVLDKLIFGVSRYISLIISDTRFSKRKKGLINEGNLKKYLEIAKPGDIFLTRTNREASNLSIPGFWKHMSMYLGKGKFLKKNFAFKFLGNLEDNTHYIIEATGMGIEIVPIFKMILHNDYLGVSRTNFTKEKIKRTIKNSLENVGKGYDFRFNFHSDKNLVCSELVLKSYAKEFEKDEGINIMLEDIGISLTFLPNNFVNLLFKLKNKKTKKVYPIFFIDSIEKTGENFISTNEEFLKSRKRPRSTLFLK